MANNDLVVNLLAVLNAPGHSYHQCHASHLAANDDEIAGLASYS